ncbi:glutamate racemase [Marinomonas sp. M1K-6]|uniref:Glutamate racemase n=1 Tax=Marinomonas profundi TaxID=2726122 RepID=A0A847QZA8_9GAMM|nr:glutamate racemase [Marinomonas profundi]NLQ16301.1 glutamate racemase [Marinomonas profundi]UDV03123.1 glutamate racemase [Marinomonas profundi]
MKVGVMDSGAGGLTILNAIHQKQPYLDLLYLADDAFAPYGSKSVAQLQDRLVKIGRFFETEKVSAIVVACNTATVAAIDALRASTLLPVIGVEPAVKPAFRLSKQRKVAVLATPVTAQSPRLKQLIALWKSDSEVSIMSSATLAFDIDAWPDSQAKVTETIQQLSQAMRAQQIDTLVLACTHYPLVKHLFEQALGSECDIVEPSAGVTAQLIRRLEATYPEAMCLLQNPLSQVEGTITLCSSLASKNMHRLVSWVEAREDILDLRHVSI